ncbi:MAG TPA: glycosyltransferase [Chthonomonadaceae bacterium]|nr:glycosyltransferase [Chthonomonadaceae bacterium]
MAGSVETMPVDREAAVRAQDRPAKPLRVLAVIPGEAEGASMIFCKRQAASVESAGAVGRMFFLTSRTSPVVLLREWRRLRAEIREFAPDVVHAHFGSVTAFFCVLATRRPLVVSYRGSDLNPAPSMSQLRWQIGRFLSQLSALRARRIVCVSQEVKRRLWWRQGRATVIPTGVDIGVFYPRPRQEARAELGWGPQEKVVLFNAGRTPEVKRLDLAQAAVEVAQGLCGAIRFVVLDGYVEPKLVPVMMNGADCLVFTSDFEGSPNIVKEAIACNLPVVSVEVGDVRERLAGVHPSRIVPRDPEQIGKALAEILQLGQRSNGFEAAQALSLECLAGRMLEVYRAALSRQQRRLS